MRIIDFFDKGFEAYPDRVFIQDAQVRHSYRQAHQLSHRIAAAMQRAPVPVPVATHVAVYAPNCAIALECVLGIFRAGCVWVPVNARNGVADNAQLLSQLDVRVIFFHSSFAAEVQALQARCPQLTLAVCIDVRDPNVQSLADWLDRVPSDAWVDVPASRNDTAAIFATGGTTGLPKGAVWGHGQFETLIASTLMAMPPKSPPVHLVTAPLTHAAGCFALILSAVGATHIVLGATDPASVLQAIAREKITYLYLPPTLIYMILSHPDIGKHDYSSLEYLMYGAAPMSADKLKESLRVFGPVMSQTYGQMEVPGICTHFSPAQHLVALRDCPERLLSCGRASALTQVRIMDDVGTFLAPRQVGEIVARGNLVMQGYYKNPQATADASAFGWHHTGDLGFVDEEGFIYIVDRKKDMIISGGFNIYPGEIEQVIWSHPSVQDCAVIGVPDDKWGEAVKAVVELKPGMSATESELLALCKQRLGSLKTPKSLEFWPSLPRTPVGKVRKKDIREPFWRGHDRKI